MQEFKAIVEQVLVQLPVLLVLVVGLILVAVRGRLLSGRARSLAIAGMGMLLLGVVLAVSWYAAIPSIAEDRQLTESEYGPIDFGVNILLSTWQAAGLALLIGAAVSLAPRPVSAGRAKRGDRPAPATAVPPSAA